MPKGHKCPFCRESRSHLVRGAYQCKNEECLCIWWTPFTQPFAGQSGKGQKCMHCDNNTIHSVGTLESVTIWRCTICASIMVKPNKKGITQLPTREYKG